MSTYGLLSTAACDRQTASGRQMDIVGFRFKNPKSRFPSQFGCWAIFQM